MSLENFIYLILGTVCSLLAIGTAYLYGYQKGLDDGYELLCELLRGEEAEL